MTAFPVVVRAGRDYYSPPLSGDSLLPADALTNPARWIAGGYGYDNTQPAPVAVAAGMALTWTTDVGKNGFQGVWFNAVAGKTYTLSVTVRAPVGAARWWGTIGWTTSSSPVTPDGYDQTRTLSWRAPETRQYAIGVETSGPNTGTYTVVSIGVWDHDDPGVVWAPRDLDRCRVALPLEVVHGRSGTGSQPDAPTCKFTHIGSDAPTALGDSIEVEVTGAPGATWTDPGVLWTDTVVSWLGTRGRSLRFRGFVTSLKAVEAEGQVVAWAVEATGEQARLGRIPVLLSRPQETDVQRIEAIAAAAGITVDIVGSPGVTLAPDNIDRDALSAMHEVCASSGGIVWQQRDGSIAYGTQHRYEVMPEQRIMCDLILDGIEWTHDTNDIVNHVTVEYGLESSLRFQTGEWRMDTSTTMADPGTGQVRMNGADAASTTRIAVSKMTWDGADGTLVLRSIAVNDSLVGQQKDDADRSARWNVASAPVDHGSWWEVPVTLVASGGGGTVSKNTQVLLNFGNQRGGREQDTYRDDASIGKWGYRHLDVSTQCATATDAVQVGAFILGRRKQPRWVMPGVVALRDKATDAQWEALMVLDFGHTALIDVETSPTPTPGAITSWTVEGWVETWESAGRRMQLALSEYRLGAPIPWSAADDETWGYWATNASWLTAMVEV